MSGTAAGTGGEAAAGTGGLPSFEVVELELVRVVNVRSIVAAEDVPDFMSDALGLVAGALREAGLEPAGPPFARYFAMTAEGLDVAAGFPVAEPFLGSGVVYPGELPSGPAAVATHVGSHAGLEAAWAAVRGQIRELGRIPGDDPWEVFLVDPGSGVDEAEWHTELVWPLAPVTAVG